jgi:hypothetical protein
MSAWVQLVSERAGLAFIAGPFATLTDAQTWASHWHTPSRPRAADAHVDLRQADAERAGALPPTDWIARAGEEPGRW